MPQEQPQYYRAVPVSEKPKKSGYYLTPLGKIYYSSRKEAFMVRKPTNYLEPIPIPDADRLRELLSEMCGKVEVMFEEKRDNPKDKDNAKTRAFNRLAFCLTRAKNYLQTIPSPPLNK